jgi:hypothetical protein
MADPIEKRFKDGCKVHGSLSCPQSLKVSGLGGVLVLIVGLSAYGIGVSAPDGLYSVSPPSLQLLIWACLGGIIGGAGRSLYFMKVEFGGHSHYCPSWYMDKWSLYIFKVILGMIGGVSLFLIAYVFSNALGDPKSPPVFFRIILTSLGGGMFFEGAFDQLRRGSDPTDLG